MYVILVQRLNKYSWLFIFCLCFDYFFLYFFIRFSLVWVNSIHFIPIRLAVILHSYESIIKWISIRVLLPSMCLTHSLVQKRKIYYKIMIKAEGILHKQRIEIIYKLIIHSMHIWLSAWLNCISVQCSMLNCLCSEKSKTTRNDMGWQERTRAQVNEHWIFEHIESTARIQAKCLNNSKVSNPKLTSDSIYITNLMYC